MKVLVITDNTQIHDFASPILGRYEETVEFTWACSPSSSTNEELGLSAIDVKGSADTLAAEYDLILSLHCKQIFPPKLVNGTTCINLHPGFLPYNRGYYPHVFSIINGLPAGATLHIMNHEIDAGPIIAQLEVTIEESDTSLEAYNKILLAEKELLENNIETILSKTYIAKPSPSKGNYNSKQNYLDLCRLDLNETISCGELLKRLRALSHGSFQNAFYTDKNGNKLYIKATISTD